MNTFDLHVPVMLMVEHVVCKHGERRKPDVLDCLSSVMDVTSLRMLQRTAHMPAR